METNAMSMIICLKVLNAIVAGLTSLVLIRRIGGAKATLSLFVLLVAADSGLVAFRDVLYSAFAKSAVVRDMTMEELPAHVLVTAVLVLNLLFWMCTPRAPTQHTVETNR